MLRSYKPAHSGIYEAEDLKRLIAKQLTQSGNRISSKELDRLTKLLELETTKVAQLKLDWKQVLKLSADDPIGPKLLDELHSSGQSVFPVVSNKSSKEINGLLYSESLNLRSEGLVRQFMQPIVRYVNEDESLASALTKFAASSQGLLVVINNHEQTTGVLTLKESLGELLAIDPPSSSEDSESKTFVADLGLMQGVEVENSEQ